MSSTLLNRKLLLLALIFLVFIALTAIYLIDKKNQTSNLIGYETFKNSILSAQKNEDIANNRSFRAFFDRIAQLENQTLTKEQQKNQLILAGGNLFEAYASTNNHDLYKLTADFKKFGEANFSDFKLNIQCLDPTCAEQPIPAEIATVINEINKSTLSAEFKSPIIKDLNTYSYLSDSDKEYKAVNYLMVAESVRMDPEFTKAGINIKIYNDIRSYVENYYSEAWSKYSDFKFITEGN